MVFPVLPLSVPLANVQLWTTPLWILSIGVTLGLVLLAALWGIFWLVNRGAAKQAASAVAESVLVWILYAAAAIALFGVVAAPQMPLAKVMDSLRRLPSSGERTALVVVEPQSIDQEVSFDLVADEVIAYRIESDQDIRVADVTGEAYLAPTAIVAGDEPYAWNTKSKLKRGLEDRVSKLYLTNEGDAPANVSLSFTSEVLVPETRQIPVVALSLAGLFVVYVLLRWLTPGISNIAAATAKEAANQPIYLLLMAGGAVALFCYIYIPYNTFGEDVKMLKDSGLSTIMVLAILFAVWTASVSIADEIEGKTALTLLSKPISRRQFIIGKYLGILWPVVLMFVLLGGLLMACVSYKVVYDSRESSNPTPEWQLCHAEMVGLAPGLVLAGLEVAVLTAISVAVSTRLPMLPNLLIVGSIYAVGHLTPLLVQSSIGENEFVAFFGQLIALVLPMLDHLNIQPAIAAGQAVPASYLLVATLYSALYCVIALLLALLLFEDRDLA
ncbi:ABC transporter permease [Botrimarina hoheduenensis]|uniref:ABC-2 family transporter protein n=1 Tax=Botrimarina hoheduenensis TaxID=2528000 RepID=A0A5C5WF03_9BACT|nr:ABC transporter permease subunit [Botrimarina hoheduenensis]TWT48635.1 ABC-2 family transporter protein [Botrimarina hoheduenensis]